MRKSPLATVIRILFLFYLVSLLGLLIYGVIITLIQSKIVADFRVSYGIARGLDLFINYLISIHCASLLVTYSLAFKSSPISPTSTFRGPFSGLVSGTLVLFIIFTSLYTFLMSTTLPLLQRNIQEKEFLSSSAQDFLLEARRLSKQEQYPTAVVYYNLYMGIDKQNEEIKRERSRLLEKISKMPARPKQEERPAEGPGGAEISGKQIESFLDEASKSMERKDYFLALYYADLASRLDSKNTSADIIKKEALKKVNEQSTVRDKDIVSKLFEEKLAGFDDLKKEDFVAAYFAFKKLSQEHPEDREISQFLEASLAGLEKTAFFTDEVETNLVLPGVRRIVFINRQNEAERELVYINRIAKTPKGLYLYGIEAMSFSTRGEVGYHLRAPFGKYMTSGEQQKAYINMHCLDKNSPEYSLLPTFESTSEQLEKEMRYMIALDQKLEYLPYFSPGSAAVTRAGMIDLWNMREAYEKAGYDPHVLMMELLMRILNPFLFLILSLVSVCLGWSLRARYLSRTPIFAYLLVPLLPFVILQLINLLRYAHRVVLGFALLSFGFGVALTALIILEALLLVLSIVLLAGRTTE